VPLVIKYHDPVRQRLWLAFAIILMLGSAWLLYDYGRQQAGFDSAVAAEEIAALTKTVDELSAGNQLLREQVAIHKRAVQIELQAKTELVQHLKQLQDDKARLREDLAFYRKIVSTAAGSPELKIHSMEISRLGQGSAYHFRLVLTQLGKNDSLAEGNVMLFLNGLQGGVTQRRNISELMSGAKRQIPYQFKFFQKLDGDFTLPKGFTPRSLVVRVIPKGKGRATPKELSRKYIWSDLVSKGDM